MTRALIGYGSREPEDAGSSVDMSTSLSWLDLPAPVMTASK